MDEGEEFIFSMFTIIPAEKVLGVFLWSSYCHTYVLRGSCDDM